MTWQLDQLVLSPGTLTYFMVTILLILTSTWLIKRRRKTWFLDQIPGPKGLPIIGNALDLLNLEPEDLLKKINGYSDYGEMTRVWVGFQPYLFISGASIAEIVLSSSKFLEKSFDYRYLQPWLGTGLLTSSGSKWHSRRKLLTPAFHFKILEDFIDVFNIQSKKLVQKLEDEANGKPFNIYPYITRCTLDIICETAMGTSINAQDVTESTYVNAIYKIGHMMQQRMLKAWQHNNLTYQLSGYAKKRDFYIKILHDLSLDTIRERRMIFQEKEKKKKKKEEAENEHSSHSEEGDDYIGQKKQRLAFLDLLLEYCQDGQALSDEDLREEVDTFMFEGHDTTTSATNWTLYLLGLHPEIQARVHEELDNIFGCSDRPVNTTDLRELKYLENCIKESLRIFPPVPFFGRELKEEVMINNYRIPANTSITVMTYPLHRDPKQFPNPEVFDPDRFLPENSKNRHPFAYIPFSAGPRNCIGQKFAMMEEKIILSNILRHYRVESNEPRDKIIVIGELILRPANGNQLKLFPRTESGQEMQ